MELVARPVEAEHNLPSLPAGRRTARAVVGCRGSDRAGGNPRRKEVVVVMGVNMGIDAEASDGDGALVPAAAAVGPEMEVIHCLTRADFGSQCQVPAPDSWRSPLVGPQLDSDTSPGSYCIRESTNAHLPGRPPSRVPTGEQPPTPCFPFTFGMVARRRSALDATMNSGQVQFTCPIRAADGGHNAPVDGSSGLQERINDSRRVLGGPITRGANCRPRPSAGMRSARETKEEQGAHSGPSQRQQRVLNATIARAASGEQVPTPYIGASVRFAQRNG